MEVKWILLRRRRWLRGALLATNTVHHIAYNPSQDIIRKGVHFEFHRFFFLHFVRLMMKYGRNANNCRAPEIPSCTFLFTLSYPYSHKKTGVNPSQTILSLTVFVCAITHKIPPSPKKRKQLPIHSWLNDFQYHLRHKITDQYVINWTAISLVSIQLQSKQYSLNLKLQLKTNVMLLLLLSNFFVVAAT